MHFLKQLRFVAALLAAFFVLSLTACGSGSNSFTWFVDSIPANLDPQVASSASDIIACENLYSGLVRRTPDGSLAPELCERWEVSADRLTYTFYLKDGLTYTASKGDPSDYAITAEDFVFAFQRMFLPGTNSPYAVEFSALENSAAVLAGQKPASALGVTAAEPLKLVFRLSSPDETFLSKLTLPGAMPCDEAFFDSTRGTYGLTSASTLSSGHFYLYNWTSSGLFLRRAASGSQIDSLRLVENTTSSGQSAPPPSTTAVPPPRCRACPTPTPHGRCSSTATPSLLPLSFGRRWAVQPLRRWKSLAAGCSRRQRASSPTA